MFVDPCIDVSIGLKITFYQDGEKRCCAIGWVGKDLLQEEEKGEVKSRKQADVRFDKPA